MSATTNLTINDGTANQTFAPVKRDGDRLSFLNKVGSVVAAYKTVVLGFSLFSARRQTTKVSFDLDHPLARTDANGVTTATNVIRWRITGTIPVVATGAERTESYNLMKNGIATGAFQAMAITDDPML